MRKYLSTVAAVVLATAVWMLPAGASTPATSISLSCRRVQVSATDALIVVRTPNTQETVRVGADGGQVNLYLTPAHGTYSVRVILVDPTGDEHGQYVWKVC